MPRAKSRPVSMDNLKHVMKEGEIWIGPCNDKRLTDPKESPLGYPVKYMNKEDKVLMLNCGDTMMLDKRETANFIAALRQAADRQWGSAWWMEVMDVHS